MSPTATRARSAERPAARGYAWSGSDPKAVAALKAARADGIREGIALNQREMSKAKEELDRIYNEALFRALKVSEAVFDRLSSRLEVECERIYLREDDFKSYSVLFFVRGEDFADVRFIEAYAIAEDAARMIKGEDFDYSYSFVPVREGFRHEKLVVDGYAYHFPAVEGENAEELS